MSKESAPSTVRHTIILLDNRFSHAKVDGVDCILADGDGHAYAGYAVAPGDLTIIFVRPNGVVGGILSSEQGLLDYVDGILSPQRRCKLTMCRIPPLCTIKHLSLHMDMKMQCRYLQTLRLMSGSAMRKEESSYVRYAVNVTHQVPSLVLSGTEQSA